MAERFLQSHFKASLPLLEAASEELHPRKGLSDMGRLQRVVVLNDLLGVVNLRINCDKLDRL